MAHCSGTVNNMRRLNPHVLGSGLGKSKTCLGFFSIQIKNTNIDFKLLFMQSVLVLIC